MLLYSFVYFFSIKYFAELKNDAPKQPETVQSQPIGDGKMIHVDSVEDFDNKVKNAGSKLVVTYVYATWCGIPCVRIAPFLDKFAEMYASKIVILKVNFDELPDLTSQYGMGRYFVTSVPTIILLKDGKTVEQFSGSSEVKIAETIKKYLN